MMARIEFLIPYDIVGTLSFGRYMDQYQAYKYIHNFRVKNILYQDVEDEIKKYQQAHRKIDSVFSI
jgi:hypothetical protein